MPHRTALPVFADLASHAWVTPRFVGELTENLELEVLTFNVHGLPRWLGGPPADQFDRIAAAIQEEAADIVLLQEAWTRAARRSAPHDPGWNIATGIRGDTFFEQSGLVTASRFRIIGGEFRRFSRASLPDSLVEKGALKVTVVLPGGLRANVWNVHLQAGRAAHIRAHQAAELIRWVREAEDGQALDLVGGDFNCTPDGPEYRALAADLGADVRRLDGRPHEPTFPEEVEGGSGGRTLDYVFWSPRAPVRLTAARSEVVFDAEQGKERLSDHLGVRVSLGVATSAEPVASMSPSLVLFPHADVKMPRLLAPFHEAD
ncbi:MAG: endonuclease/exonuclease/phosphatase family protein [Verrucomicrobia bacterium]|nr:endonuclease/exonuclease/phosphatase family protein [Verrucomicrobiota bacterium]